MGDAPRQLSRLEYPPGLMEIPEPPAALYLRGSMPQPGTTLLAVVGSRDLSPYGREACTRLIEGLRGHPISIVSGLALGTDACAHEAALAANLHTIAIPGSGIGDQAIAPRSNLPLAQKILRSGGALMTEYPDTYRVHKGSFPRRNRIMVGISKAVLMIEAGEKSGTLITARLTHEYNRDLLCVPHRITDPHGYGAHLFTRLGAATVSCSEQILEELGLAP